MSRPGAMRFVMCSVTHAGAGIHALTLGHTTSAAMVSVMTTTLRRTYQPLSISFCLLGSRAQKRRPTREENSALRLLRRRARLLGDAGDVRAEDVELGVVALVDEQHDLVARLALEVDDGPADAAGGAHLVALLQLLEHPVQLLLALLLRA